MKIRQLEILEFWFLVITSYSIHYTKLYEVAEKNKAYIRIIRPSESYENVIEVKDIKQACDFLSSTTGNVLVTTGSKESYNFV